MNEIRGNLFDTFKQPNTIVVVTTNSTLNSKGALVMGAGTALWAKQQCPNLPDLMGLHIKAAAIPTEYLYLEFPAMGIGCLQTKYDWRKSSPISLIEKSVRYFAKIAEYNPLLVYNMSRPGCGLGGLTWNTIKPLCEILPDNVNIYFQ